LIASRDQSRQQSVIPTLEIALGRLRALADRAQVLCLNLRELLSIASRLFVTFRLRDRRGGRLRALLECTGEVTLGDLVLDGLLAIESDERGLALKLLDELLAFLRFALRFGVARGRTLLESIFNLFASSTLEFIERQSRYLRDTARARRCNVLRELQQL